MSDKKTITLEQLKQLEPITSLSEERLQELMPLSYVEHLGMGANLFREGDIDNQTVYLLHGDVQLSSSDGKIDKVISHKDPEARFPLDDSQPRQASCSALMRVEIVRIDNSVLDYMMMWDQMAVSEATTAPAIQQPVVAEKQALSAAVPQPQAHIDTVVITEPVSDEEDRSWIRPRFRTCRALLLPCRRPISNNSLAAWKVCPCARGTPSLTRVKREITTMS